MKHLSIMFCLFLIGCVSVPYQLTKPPRYTQCEEKHELECSRENGVIRYVETLRCFDQRLEKFVYVPDDNKEKICSEEKTSRLAISYDYLWGNE